MDIREQYRKVLDIQYSYELAKKMEEIRSHPRLGYRTAGSQAELATGRMLEEEMKALGFPKVWKDAITVDAWEFKDAVLTYTEDDGQEKEILLGAYQTDYITSGTEEYTLVYAGKGTKEDYSSLDVTGKLVLADINQRDEWWINYPVYQAHLKGAAALIAAQTGGYGEVDETALNAQDIAGPSDAPAFSISRRDAAALKKLLHTKGELTVKLKADTRVIPNQTTYNIVGMIPGKNRDRMIILSAHYDSYFDGFQDDNTAVAMMLGIAKALFALSYQPENTLLFVAMAAEEWGVADSQFDWSSGAYEQVFTVHPEWRGKVIADLNFELPALAHGTRARIRSTYEYIPFLENFLKNLPELTYAYPEEPRAVAPIETWSDDFSIAIAGIPSMVNDFTGGSFMENNYHSQFDNDSYYDEDVYRYHHELFGLLLMAIDHTVVVPLNFCGLFKRAAEVLELSWCERAGADGEALLSELKQAVTTAEKSWQMTEKINAKRSKRQPVDDGAESLLWDPQACREWNPQACREWNPQVFREWEQKLLQAFQKEQDAFVRIDWYGNVLFPHQILQEHLKLLSGAAEDLEEGNLSSALHKLYHVDNNAYAFQFEEEVYRHFTDYALKQSPDRLKWGYQRIIGHENLFHVVQSLLEKKKNGQEDYEEEIILLKKAVERQLTLYRSAIKDLTVQVREMRELLSWKAISCTR